MGYYDRYRGTKRKKQQRKLLMISIVLLFLIIVAVGLLVLGDHITYSADGFHFTWGDTPATGDKPVDIPKDDPNSDPDDDPDYVIDGDKPSPNFTLSQGQLGSQLVIADQFMGLNHALPSPLNGYAVWVKDAAGIRYLPSAIDQYNNNGIWTSIFSLTLSGKLSQLNNVDGMHTVAVLNAFRDPILPYKAYGAAGIKAGSNFWLDANGSSWLDPATAGGNIIVVEMVKRCKAAGFDEILLTDFRYPTAQDGDTSTITSINNAAKANSITAVAKQVKNTIGSADIRLSCLLTATAAQTMTDSAAGQDVAKLAQYVDCFYVETDTADVDLTALKAALAGTGCKIALWYTGNISGYPTEYDFISLPNA
jgi:hypothetical protein